MSTRTATLVAWTLWTLSLAIRVTGYVLDALNGHRFSAPILGEIPAVIAITVGALIVSRRPSNRVGWLLIFSPFLLGFGGSGNFADQYAIYAFITHPGSLPAGDWVELMGLVTQIVGFVPLATLLPLLFPDGHTPSPRWKPLIWLTVVETVISVLIGVLSPRLNNGPVDIPNPIGRGIPELIANGAAIVSTVLAVAIVLLCVASVFVRFRHAREDERQQIKWFGYGALLIPLTALVAVLAGLLNQNWVFDIPLWQLSVAGIPVAVGIAVLKYRLYDIDLIIRRTLVYAVLTGLLALVYFASVLILEQLSRVLTGQRQNEIIIVLSTLAIAALFAPLRNAIQQLIDRRLYRRRYDAALVLAHFGGTVRDEVDLGRLKEDLLDVVNETMQPTAAGLWLKLDEARHQRTEQ